MVKCAMSYGVVDMGAPEETVPVLRYIYLSATTFPEKNSPVVGGGSMEVQVGMLTRSGQTGCTGYVSCRGGGLMEGKLTFHGMMNEIDYLGKILHVNGMLSTCNRTLYDTLTLTCDVRSVEPRSMVSVTASAVVPLRLVFPPDLESDLESDVSFRVGVVIMIPYWASAASLVRRRSRELSLR